MENSLHKLSNVSINDQFFPLQICFHFLGTFLFHRHLILIFFSIELYSVSLSELFALVHMFFQKRMILLLCFLTLVLHERNALYSIPTKTDDLNYWQYIMLTLLLAVNITILLYSSLLFCHLAENQWRGKRKVLFIENSDTFYEK